MASGDFAITRTGGVETGLGLYKVPVASAE